MMDEIEHIQTKPLCLLDVGASGGTDSKWYKYTGKIVSILFEPDPREYERLKKQNSTDVVVLNTALSDHKGEVDFHLCQKQEVSSILVPDRQIVDKFPDSARFEILKTVKVPVDTIDNQLQARHIADVDFIKIDTQGHELAILKGASNALKSAIGLEVEVEFLPIYENQPVFRDIDTFIADQGFELFDIKRYFWKRNNPEISPPNQKGQLVMGDALYFRTPETICNQNNTDADKILNAVIVYLTYGYTDLADGLCHQAFECGIISETLRNKILNSIKSLSKVKSLFPGLVKFRKLMTKILNRLHNLLIYNDSPYDADKTLGNSK
jgi:FkbM family methyltransferase